MSGSIQEISNQELVDLYSKTCMGIEPVMGFHPMGFNYGRLQKALKEEIFRRMATSEEEKPAIKEGETS